MPAFFCYKGDRIEKLQRLVQFGAAAGHKKLKGREGDM
jgi:hypothetical protein